MTDKVQIQELFKNNPELLEEMRNYFHPKPEIVKVLPSPKSVEDFKVVYIKSEVIDPITGKPVTIYTEYKMLNGAWYESN